MYDALDIETGEIVKTFEGFYYRWSYEGKTHVKRFLKTLGYEVVRTEYTNRGMYLWVRKIEEV